MPIAQRFSLGRYTHPLNHHDEREFPTTWQLDNQHFEPVSSGNIHVFGSLVPFVAAIGSQALPPNHWNFRTFAFSPSVWVCRKSEFRIPNTSIHCDAKNYSRGNVLTAFLINLARCKKGTSRSGGQAGNSEFTFGWSRTLLSLRLWPVDVLK